MRKLQWVALLSLIATALCFAQQEAPFTPDSLTRGLWHFDETSGATLLDVSGAGNTGIATGTTIVAGRFGNARSLNGVSDYITVPSNRMFDFDTASFRIDLWCKTPGQSTGQGQILRRGLAPVPGYMIFMDHGQIVGQIGNRADSHWPDTLITVRSDGNFGDSLWHLVTMVRDRSVHKLFLYVDGTLATQPSEDPFIIPINNDRPLTIGRWENDSYPYFFNGVVDEVRLSSPKFIPSSVVIHVQPALLDFGKVKIGSTDTLLLNVSNGGLRDSLRISAVTSVNQRFTVPGGPLLVPAGESITIPVFYTPLSTTRDTGLVSITSNDPVISRVDIRVLGKGFVLAAEPIINNVILMPNTYYQLRVQWIRSVYDSAGMTDPVTEYSVWRSVPGQGQSASQIRSGPDALGLLALTDPSWEFITTVPAMRFDKYSCLVPAVVDYIRAGSPNVLVVAARTKNLQVFMSLPDTVNLNPGYVTGIGGTETSQTVSEFMLSQNFPNPFNPVTTIGFRVPGVKTGSGVSGLGSSEVKLAVYDVLGREVAVLVNEKREAGNYSVQFNGTGLGSGVYFYRIQVRPLDTSVGPASPAGRGDSKNGSGDFVATKKFLLMK